MSPWMMSPWMMSHRYHLPFVARRDRTYIPFGDDKQLNLKDKVDVPENFFGN
jgi:hypothetical protein